MTSIIIQWLQYNGTKWQRKRIRSNPRIVRHTIYNLKSNTKYELRVIAVNEIGQSQPSLNIQQKTDLNTKGTKIDHLLRLIFDLAKKLTKFPQRTF